MGVVIPPEDDKALKNAILDCSDGDFILQKENARKYAETNLSKSNILKSMMQAVLNA